MSATATRVQVEQILADDAKFAAHVACALPDNETAIHALREFVKAGASGSDYFIAAYALWDELMAIVEGAS